MIRGARYELTAVVEHGTFGDFSFSANKLQLVVDFGDRGPQTRLCVVNLSVGESSRVVDAACRDKAGFSLLKVDLGRIRTTQLVGEQAKYSVPLLEGKMRFDVSSTVV
jgi:hypothetical protein